MSPYADAGVKGFKIDFFDHDGYQHVSRKVSPTEKLNIHLAPAGGWTARFF